ncbi:MAG: BamA/TamA family outer membrane protein [Candidatus Eisenbacteria sp.]|nr:BamA/TamA family outer membrane protein [Candidatus Eisenbacteria bacterium]
MLPKSQPSRCRWVPLVLAVLAVSEFTAPRAAEPQAPDALPQLRISEISVTGNERTEEWVILREMATRVGMFYDSERARRDRDRIDNLNLFSEVVIDTLQRERSVAMEVRVKERLVWIPSEWIPYPVLNWNDENGWSYGLGLTNPNSSGENRSFSLLVEGGGRKLASFSFSDPWITGNHGSAGISFLFSESSTHEGYMNRWTSVRLGLGTHLGEHGRARLAFDLGEIETDAWRTASGTRRDRIRSFGPGLGYDTRDVYADPRSGGYIGGSVGFSRPVLGGNVDCTSYRVDVRKFWPARKSQVLAGRISLLFRDRPVPDYRRLRLGGTSAVRGIDPLSFKGRSLLVASLEYRVAIKEKKNYDFWFVRNVDLGLMVVAFADAGSVWDENRVPRRDRFFGSVGAGIRLLCQQVIRAEVAYSRRDGVRWIGATGMPF